MWIDLKETLASGQVFTFVPCGDGFAVVADGRPAWARQMAAGGGAECAGGVGGVAEAGLWIRCREEDADFWRRYFDLERDYSEILAPFLPDDPYLAAQVRAYAGLRILRQPVWEALCAFIISANNHQKRIESICRGVSARYGNPIHWEDLGIGDEISLYGFPSPAALAEAGEEGLRRLGAGYRAGYLAATAQMVAGGFSLDLDGMDYETALKHLIQLPGVGEKVADCVLAFSTRHSCAFPVDVWIERVLRDRYGMRGSRKAIKREAQARFGEWAGIAQQYLFHGARNARRQSAALHTP